MGQCCLRSHALEKSCGDFQISPHDLGCESRSRCIPNVATSRIRNELLRFHRAIDLAVHAVYCEHVAPATYEFSLTTLSANIRSPAQRREAVFVPSAHTHTRDASFDRLHTAAYTVHTELGPATCMWRAYVCPAENKIVRGSALCVKGLP